MKFFTVIISMIMMAIMFLLAGTCAVPLVLLLYFYRLYKKYLSFYAPGLKGLLGASSNQIVCPSVCYSILLTMLTYKVQYLQFVHTVTKLGLYSLISFNGCSHFTDITLRQTYLRNFPI